MLVSGMALSVPPLASAQDGLTTANVNITNLPPTNVVAASIVARGANERIWGQIAPWQTNAQGTVLYRTNHPYTEIASGLSHLVGTNWIDSTEGIQITPDGGAATNGQHQVYFAANVNTAGSIHLVTPDNQHLQGNVIGLSYFDSTGNTNVLFAILKDSTGHLYGSNQVIYSAAFSNLNADSDIPIPGWSGTGHNPAGTAAVPIIVWPQSRHYPFAGLDRVYECSNAPDH